MIAGNEDGAAVADATQAQWQFVRIPPPSPTTIFFSDTWSPDGTRVAGMVREPGSDRNSRVAIYTLASHTYQYFDLPQIGTAVPESVTWLPDGSSIVVTTSAGGVLAIDTATKQAREVLPPMTHGAREGVTFSHDGRALSYVSRSPRTEIWMAKTE